MRWVPRGDRSEPALRNVRYYPDVSHSGHLQRPLGDGPPTRTASSADSDLVSEGLQLEGGASESLQNPRLHEEPGFMVLDSRKLVQGNRNSIILRGQIAPSARRKKSTVGDQDFLELSAV